MYQSLTKICYSFHSSIPIRKVFLSATHIKTKQLLLQKVKNFLLEILDFLTPDFVQMIILQWRKIVVVDVLVLVLVWKSRFSV